MLRSLVPLTLLTLAACGDDGRPGDNAPDAGGAACLDDAQLAALNDHAEVMRASAAMLSGHPGPREATGFFLFVDLEVQRLAVFAGPLVMKCSGPSMYDPYCEKDGLCSQIECTGAGTSWAFHFWLDAPSGDYQTATVDTAWAEGDTGITFATASDAGAWSVAGAGRMDADTFELEETYTELLPGSEVVLTMMDTSAGEHSGAITIDGEVFATADADGVYTASGCP